MELVNVPPIPTIAHLMVAKDTPFPKHNEEVRKSEEFLPGLLSLADDERSANVIWKPAGLQFKLNDTNIVEYQLREIGLTPQDVKESVNEVHGVCDPDNQHDQHVFRAIQEKFGKRGFHGLQVFMWARIAVGGGCAMSKPEGTIGSVWLEAQSVSGSTGFRLMAHEIGHFLTLRHVVDPPPDSKRLMTPDFRGPLLTEPEIAQAKQQARVVMNQ